MIDMPRNKLGYSICQKKYKNYFKMFKAKTLKQGRISLVCRGEGNTYKDEPVTRGEVSSKGQQQI